MYQKKTNCLPPPKLGSTKNLARNGIKKLCNLTHICMALISIKYIVSAKQLKQFISFQSNSVFHHYFYHRFVVECFLQWKSI